jgi:hypothetical protein
MTTEAQSAYYERLRKLAVAADAGWGPDGWYSEHEFQHAFRHTTTDLAADVAYLRAASPDVVGLLDAVAQAWDDCARLAWGDDEDLWPFTNPHRRE